MKDSELFIKEFYKRDFQYHLSKRDKEVLDFNLLVKHPNIKNNISIYKNNLPAKKDDPILDLGFGDGWFLGICLKLGYENIFIADYDANEKISNIPEKFQDFITILNIQDNIPELLNNYHNYFKFIHLSHVVEHIPRYTLFDFSDSIKGSLGNNATFMLRTPNMLSPISQYLFYSTLGHEYGFAPLNMLDYLRSAGFEEIKFHSISNNPKNLKQLFGRFLKKLFMLSRAIEFRVLQGEFPLTLENELIVSCKKIN